MALYSYSRIGSFFTCPRQYKFRYIDKPKIERKTGVEAFMGTMVHETLEKCFHLVKVDKTPSLDDLENLYRRLWEEKLPENLNIVRKEMTADDYLSLGLKSLRMFYERYHPFDQDMTLGLERRVDFGLDGEGKYRMQGFIDRLSRDADGRLLIQDYKTSGTLPTQPEMDKDAQLALYQIAIDEMWPNNSGIVLVWYFLQFDTTFVSHRSLEQLEELRQTYIHKIQQIEKATELNNFPANETNLCNWCEYREICPAKGGTGKVDEPQEELPLVTGAPLRELVDDYIALDTQKKEIGKQLERMKRQLIDAAKHENTKLIEGRGDGAVKVSTMNMEKLPTMTADKDKFWQIDEIIRQEGLFETYGQLDIRRLQKAFNEMKLPEDIQDTLSGMTVPHSSSTVRISIKKKGA